jgi:hypothetical protein
LAGAHPHIIVGAALAKNPVYVPPDDAPLNRADLTARTAKLTKFASLSWSFLIPTGHGLIAKERNISRSGPGGGANTTELAGFQQSAIAVRHIAFYP